MSSYKESDFSKRFAGKLVKTDDNGKLKSVYQNNDTRNFVNDLNNNVYASKQETFEDTQQSSETTPFNKQINKNQPVSQHTNFQENNNQQNAQYNQHPIPGYNQQININESQYNNINNISSNNEYNNNNGNKQQTPFENQNNKIYTNDNQKQQNNQQQYEKRLTHSNNIPERKNRTNSSSTYMKNSNRQDDISSVQSEPVRKVQRKLNKNIPMVQNSRIDKIKTNINILSNGIDVDNNSDYTDQHGQSNIHSKSKETSQQPQTLKEQKNRFGPEKIIMAKSLGPDIGTEEWFEKKAKQIKALEFSQKVREVHQNLPPSNLRKPKEIIEENDSQNSAMSKAKNYAKNVPKPKVRIVGEYAITQSDKDNQSDNDLDQLELQHEQYKSTIEAIKKKIQNN